MRSTSNRFDASGNDLPSPPPGGVSSLADRGGTRRGLRGIPGAGTGDPRRGAGGTPPETADGPTVPTVHERRSDGPWEGRKRGEEPGLAGNLSIRQHSTTTRWKTTTTNPWMVVWHLGTHNPKGTRANPLAIRKCQGKRRGGPTFESMERQKSLRAETPPPKQRQPGSANPAPPPRVEKEKGSC